MTRFIESIASWGFAAKALAWGGAMVGVLQLRHLSGSWSHLICGPWGCGPPLEAVLTCHLVWFLLLIPTTISIGSHLAPDAVKICGWVATGLGLAGLTGIAVWMAVTWLPEASSFHRVYAAQKYAFTVACLVDVPLVQLTLCGGVLLAWARRLRKHRQVDDSELSLDEAGHAE